MTVMNSFCKTSNLFNKYIILLQIEGSRTTFVFSYCIFLRGESAADNRLKNGVLFIYFFFFITILNSIIGSVCACDVLSIIMSGI